MERAPPPLAWLIPCRLRAVSLKARVSQTPQHVSYLCRWRSVLDCVSPALVHQLMTLAHTTTTRKSPQRRHRTRFSTLCFPLSLFFFHLPVLARTLAVDRYVSPSCEKSASMCFGANNHPGRAPSVGLRRRRPVVRAVWLPPSRGESDGHPGLVLQLRRLDERRCVAGGPQRPGESSKYLSKSRSSHAHNKSLSLSSWCWSVRVLCHVSVPVQAVCACTVRGPRSVFCELVL